MTPCRLPGILPEVAAAGGLHESRASIDYVGLDESSSGQGYNFRKNIPGIQTQCNFPHFPLITKILQVTIASDTELVGHFLGMFICDVDVEEIARP